jgi:hypothetical protein
VQEATVTGQVADAFQQGVALTGEVAMVRGPFVAPVDGRVVARVVEMRGVAVRSGQPRFEFGELRVELWICDAQFVEGTAGLKAFVQQEPAGLFGQYQRCLRFPAGQCCGYCFRRELCGLFQVAFAIRPSECAGNQ